MTYEPTEAEINAAARGMFDAVIADGETYIRESQYEGLADVCIDGYVNLLDLADAALIAAHKSRTASDQ